MSRLIDADLLKAEFKKKKPSEFWHYIGINEMIDCAPTAYDTDNVIEQLEIGMQKQFETVCFDDGYKQEIYDAYRDGIYDAFTYAIEIVKKGGSDDSQANPMKAVKTTSLPTKHEFSSGKMDTGKMIYRKAIKNEKNKITRI